MRGTNLSRVFGGSDGDQLPARGKLGSDLKSLLECGRLELVSGFSADHVDTPNGVVRVTGSATKGSTHLGPFDRIIVATGQRPDLAMTRELRLDLDRGLNAQRPSVRRLIQTCIRAAVSRRTATMNLHTRSRDISQ